MILFRNLDINLYNNKMKRPCGVLEEQLIPIYGHITADAYDLTQVLGEPKSYFSEDRSGYILTWVYGIFTISGRIDTRNCEGFTHSNWYIRGNNGESTSDAILEVQQLLDGVAMF